MANPFEDLVPKKPNQTVDFGAFSDLVSKKQEPTPAPQSTAASFEVPTPANLAADRTRSVQPTQQRGFGERAQEVVGNVFPMARSFSREGAARALGPSISTLTTALGSAAGTPYGPAGSVYGGSLGYSLGEELTRRIRGDEPTRPLTSARDILFGGALEAGGRGVLAPLIQKSAEKAAGLVGGARDMFDLSGTRAAQLARESFETPESLSAARKALQSAAASGEDLTAQQALARAGVMAPLTQAAISRATGRTIPTQQALRAQQQEASRLSALEGVTPNITQAIANRQKAADPLYKQAFSQQVPIDDQLLQLFERMPKTTLPNARDLARMEGRSFDLDQGVVSGENLHYVKRALGDIAYGSTATTQIGQDAQKAARDLLKEYLTVVETKIPSYGQARKIYSDLSQPVNQAQVLKEMVSVLQKPGGGERVGPFLNVLGRGEEAMLRRAGGRGAPRYEALSEVLTPDQLQVVKDVAKQLETDVAVKQQVSMGEQKLADFLKDELPNLRMPNVFNVLVTTTNRFLDLLGAQVGKETLQKFAQAATTAKTFDDLLASVPASERSKLMQSLSDPETFRSLVVQPFVPRTATAGGQQAGLLSIFEDEYATR